MYRLNVADAHISMVGAGEHPTLFKLKLEESNIHSHFNVEPDLTWLMTLNIDDEGNDASDDEIIHKLDNHEIIGAHDDAASDIEAMLVYIRDLRLSTNIESLLNQLCH